MIALPKVREQFPIFQQKVHNKPLAFLDSGASAQKPQCVINAEKECYETYYANIHRGVYQFSEYSTAHFEGVRKIVQNFLHADSSDEIIFTKGTTESINLVAQSFGRMTLKQGDTVIISAMEHHANIIPWQIICTEKGANLKIIPINELGELCYDSYTAIMDKTVKIVAITQTSNVLGTINNIPLLVEAARKVGAYILVDGAQGVVDQPLDVVKNDIDFYVFSAHKLYGPSGVGVLYGKKSLLNAMPPYQTGGDMVDLVTFERTTFAPLPNKFEAGTPNIAGVIATGVAINWIQTLGFDLIYKHKQALLKYATERLLNIPSLTIYGNSAHKTGIISFSMQGIHPHDLGTLLDHEGVAIRVGHHCAQPLMSILGVAATARMSLAAYSTSMEIDQLYEGLIKINKMFN